MGVSVASRLWRDNQKRAAASDEGKAAEYSARDGSTQTNGYRN
jgi:hypothetical protein